MESCVALGCTKNVLSLAEMTSVECVVRHPFESRAMLLRGPFLPEIYIKIAINRRVHIAMGQVFVSVVRALYELCVGAT